MESKTTVDILIKGGGMVGLLAAVALSKSGFEVRVEEKTAIVFKNTDDYDLRVSSITPVSVKIFQSLGVWEDIQKNRVSPFEQIKVWEDHSEEALIFEGKKIGENPLGYIIENRVIKQALLNSPHLSLRDILSPYGRGELEKKLVIAADGADSETRKQAGIECEIKNYHQQALVAHISTSKPHQKIARQRFLSTGPLGFLPLSDQHRCSIVWSQTQDLAKTLSSMPEVEFNSALQDAFGSELGEVRVISPRLVFPLKMQNAKHYIQSNLALIGDAAHTVHPLAGYGVNMGFLDAMTLARILNTARLEKRNIGGLHTLRKYERARKSENLLMQKIVDSFTVPVLRHAGIKFTEKCQFLNNFFMNWMSHHGEENAFI